MKVEEVVEEMEVEVEVMVVKLGVVVKVRMEEVLGIIAVSC